jgi:diguanylate cyclase (GGDEF)-like protein/PAS domain S-box-containing protein
MRGARTDTRSSPVGEETAADQVPDDAADDDTAHGDSTAADTPGLDIACANTAGEDAVNAVLAIVLADHPEAVFYAINANVVTVPMPDSVNLKGHDVMEGHSALDLVIPGHRGLVIDTWEKASKTGIASARVRLAADPERPIMLTFLDARAQHGVFIGAFTTDEQASEQTDEPVIPLTAPPHTPRFARARKDGLAVLLEIDEAFTQILGWEPEEVVGRRTRDLIHPDDEALAVDNWMNMLASPGPGRRVKLRHQHRDGSWVWIEVTNHNLLDDPEYKCIVAEMVDISEEMSREQLLDRLAETLPLGLLQVDSHSRVIYTNDRLHAIVGTQRANTVEEQLSNVVDEDRQVVSEAFTGVLSNGIDSDIEVRVRPYGERDTDLRYCSLNLRALTDASGGVTGAIVCLADVTESARARDELRVRATYDEVTRCYNRASTMAELEAILALDGTDRRPAVIYVDLDDFKDVNDTLGHPAGDEFLRVVAERLHRCVRAEDVVGRIGGDEFLVICPRISAATEAMNTAARLAKSLRHQIHLQIAAMPSSASIGVAWSDGSPTTAETLVAQGDIAMYESKRAGNGEPVLFDESMTGAEDAETWQWPAPPDKQDVTPPPGPVPPRTAARALRRPRRGSVGRARRHTWIRYIGMMSWVLLAIGLVASITSGMVWRSATQNSARNSAAATANSAKARLSQSLQGDFDVAGTIGTLLTINPGLTNSQLSQSFDINGGKAQHPDILAVSYIEDVAPSQLGSFAAAVKADPPFGLSSAGGFKLTPPGLRSQYCLLRLGAMEFHVIPTKGSSFQQAIAAFNGFLNPGVDECKVSIRDWSLETAETTGNAIVGSLDNLVAMTGTTAKAAASATTTLFGPIKPIFEAIPVYSTGMAPPTAAGRQADLRGWVIMLVGTDPLIDSVLASQHHMALTLAYQDPTGLPIVLDRVGRAVAGAYSETVTMGPSGRWIVHLAVPPPSGVLSPDVQGGVVALVGLLVALLLFLLLRVLVISRVQALTMVEQKSGELEHQAHHDSLTGLPNRAMVYERAEYAMARASAGGPGVVLLVIDLDGFKDVNDAFGHDVGDELLQEVAYRLSKMFGTACTVGHTGGDEFVVLTDGGRIHDPEQLGRAVLDALTVPYQVKSAAGASLSMTASIGVATGLRASASHLLRDADIALYEAKAAGKNRFVVFRPEMHTAVMDRLDLESELRTAVRCKQFFLVYQPIFDLHDMEVKAMEALLRWRHPTRGIVPPMEFIPTLESSGMIVEVDRWVLNEACRQARLWHDAGYAVSISVNKSARQFEAGNLVRDVRSALNQSGLDPRFLVIEITESVLMHDPTPIAARLRKLKQVGVRVAIDDFGTGYSSMAYLRQFPVDILKIDRSFVSDMMDSSEGEALVHTLVQLGKALGLVTVAEGIEDETQLFRLRMEECNEGQGFYYARPLEAQDAERFMAEKSISAAAETVPAAAMRGLARTRPVAANGNGQGLNGAPARGAGSGGVTVAAKTNGHGGVPDHLPT